MISWGLLAFFWMRARVVRRHDEYTTLVWSGVGSLGVALLMLAVHPSSIAALQPQTAPIVGGFSLVIASFFMLRAFGLTQTTSSVKNVILALLTNGEIIPVTIFALIVLREYSLEGLIGVSASILGIIVLNVADAVKA